MARTRGSLSVGVVSAAASTGRTIGINPRKSLNCRYTAQVVFNASSTSAKITMQGSIDGNTWKTIGSAATVVKSSSPFYSVSTSIAYTAIRALLTSRTTKAPGPPGISIYMTAA